MSDIDFTFVEMKSIDDRSAFPGKWFKDWLFDTKVFDMASVIKHHYEGGYWDYMVWNNSVPFFHLKGPCTLRNPHSGADCHMNSYLGGMIVTLYALGRYLEDKPDEDLCDVYHRLHTLIYDYAEEIGQFEEAYKMID